MTGKVVCPVLTDHIDDIQQHELTSVVSTMVRRSQGRTGYADYSGCKPIWWPRKVPFSSPRLDIRDSNSISTRKWSEVLRDLVKIAYRHYGQAYLLSGPKDFSNSRKSIPTRRGSSPLKVVSNQQSPGLTWMGHTNTSPLKPINSQKAGLPTFKVLVQPQGNPAVKMLNFRDGSPSGVGSQSREGSPVLEKLVQESTHLTNSSTSNGASPMPARLFCNTKAAVGLQPHRSENKRRMTPGHRSSARLAAAARLVQQEEKDNKFVEIFICFFCEKEFSQKSELQQHQRACGMGPPELQAVRERSPQSPRERPPCLSLESPDTYQRTSKKVFIELLGLLPQSKAVVLEQQKSLKKVDCEVIDVTEKEPPQTPTTPRTPKSLISQLSREVTPQTRRSLSLSDKPNSPFCDEDDNDSETESEYSKSDASEGDFIVRRTKSLYTIDFSSPLGERVKKHMSSLNGAGNGIVNMDKFCSNYHQFCQTPEKNQLQDRLRSRASGYPVSFKKTRRTNPKHVHMYSFTRKQQRDRYMTLNTGLNQQSRALKHAMKKCSVHITRLLQPDIQKWMGQSTWHQPSQSFVMSEVDLDSWAGPRPQFTDSDLEAEDAVFPGSPGLLSDNFELQRLLGLKTRFDRGERERSPSVPLELSQVVSEDVNAEVNEQKVIVYRTVLSELSQCSSAYRKPSEVVVLPRPSQAPLVNTDYSTDLTPPSTPEDQLSDLSVEMAVYPTGLFRSQVNGAGVPVLTVTGASHRQDGKATNKQVKKDTGVKNVVRQSQCSTTKKGVACTTKELKTQVPATKGKLSGKGSVKDFKIVPSKKSPAVKSTKTGVSSNTTKAESQCKKGKTLAAAKPMALKGKVMQKANKTTLSRLAAKKKLRVRKVLGRGEPMLTRQKSATPACGTRLRCRTSVEKGEEFCRSSRCVAKSLFSQQTLSKRVSERNTTLAGEVQSARSLKSKPFNTGSSAKKFGSVQEDALSISSSDSSEYIPRRLKRPAENKLDSRARKQHRGPPQSPKVSESSSPTVPILLFKCHLCQSEISCKSNFKNFIIRHFADAHNIHSINLVEQKLPNGQYALSIIETAGVPDNLTSGMYPAAENHLEQFMADTMTQKMSPKEISSRSAIQHNGSGLQRKRSVRLQQRASSSLPECFQLSPSQQESDVSGLSWIEG